MSRTRYPNRDALNQALDVYLDAMCQFVSECLDEQPIREALRLQSSDDLRKKIEVKDIADLIKMRWLKSFKEKFKVVDREYVRYYDARSVTSLIIEGRNRTSHPPWDLDPDFTRTQLFLIAEVLGKINRPDAQREVEVIRDNLFDDTTEQLVTTAVKAEKAKYEKSIAEVEKRLAAEKESNEKLSKQRDDKAAKLDQKTEELEKLSEQLFAAKHTKKQFDSKSRELKKVQAAHNTCKERLTSTETERDGYKEALETASKELKETHAEWKETEERLANQLAAAQAESKGIAARLKALQNLFTVAAIGAQKVQEVFQSVYPPIEKDSIVRILDRRGVDKKNYLLELVEQKQPTVIYVQSEEKIKQLRKLVGPEKADLIERHDEQTSEAEEAVILERLENGELIAVVSDTACSTLTSSHCIEHFVFCHLVPGLDEFFRRCQSAFASEKNVYLHLIYESKQDIEKIAEKFLDENVLRELYKKFRDCTPVDGNLVDPADLYDKLCKDRELKITELGIETSFSIFEELGFLEQNGGGIKRVSPPSTRTQLEKSVTYCRGEKLKREIANSPAFQYEQSIKQIWEKILEKLDVDGEQLDVDSEQTLREDSIDAVYPSVSEMESDQQPMATIENDSEEVPEVKQSEFWQPIRAGEFGELFTGKPVPISNEGWISKSIHNIGICLYLNNHRCYVQIYFHGANGSERREKIMTLFPKSEYAYTYRDTPRETKVQFPVLDKGRKDQDDWDEIRKKLVAMGTDIYNKIDASDL